MAPAASTTENIIAQWRSSLDPFVGDASLAKGAQEARFANPAAYHVNNTAQAVVPFVLEGSNEEAALAELDDLARLFALRNTAPSASLVCFSQLKALLAENLGGIIPDNQALAAAQERADRCLLYTVDKLVESREKLSTLAYNELKKRNDMLEKLNEESYMTKGGDQV